MQSNITLVLEYMTFKLSGMNLFTSLPDGHIIWLLRKKYRKLHQVVIFLLIEDIQFGSDEQDLFQRVLISVAQET